METFLFADEVGKVLRNYFPVKDKRSSLETPRLPGVSQTFYNVVNSTRKDSETRVSSYSVP